MNEADELIDLIEKILLTDQDKGNPYSDYDHLRDIIYQALQEIQFYKRYKKNKKTI